MKQKTSMRRKLSSLLVSLVLVTELLVPFQAMALFGGGPKIPSASSVAKTLEQRYHINTESVQNLGETLNVANNKKTTPEVSIFFSPTDPKEGQKISAKAFPMYFSNPNEQLYYTWYLKRKGCEKVGYINSGNAWCNEDGNSRIDENDWKITAARILATGGNEYTKDDLSDTDSDGYKAEYGGSGEVGTTNDYCYIKDSNSGVLYELASGTPASFGCSSGRTPACIAGTDTINAGQIDINTQCTATGGSGGSGGTTEGGGSGGSGGTATCENDVEAKLFETSSEYEYVASANCVNNQVMCPSGTRSACLTDNEVNSAFSYLPSTISWCSSGTVGTPQCKHLFPRPTSGTSGDGTFGRSEEEFWNTYPNDPDTADNGNKDEANVIGLGRDTFSWNYQIGDQVGLVVEGTSMIPTKHENSSSMIMWAFSKGKCDVTSKTSYNKTIKGYSVSIPATTMSQDNINDCLESNLVDPVDGSQAKRLEVSVSATPESPINDNTEEKMGDLVVASASIDNSSRPSDEVVYSWDVSLSSNPNNGWQDITGGLKSQGLLPQLSAGNGLDSIQLRLNMPRSLLNPLGFNIDTFYARVRVTATENYSSGVTRTGNGEAVLKVSNTSNKIVAYGSLVDGSGKVSYSTPICNSFFANPTTEGQMSENLNRIACRVTKNEIVGMKVSDESGLSNFRWTLNGLPISCSDGPSGISSGCGKGVFFAVAGNPGETYNVRVDAVNSSTGKSASLSRTFQIVDPFVGIESSDKTLVWPKYVGTYKSLNGGTFDDYSETAFERFDTGSIKLQPLFVPGFIKNMATCSWTIDGEVISNSCDVLDYAPTVAKEAGGIYNVSFYASLIQPENKRKALRDFWGIDALSSGEKNISAAIQIEVIDSEEIASGEEKFFAAISEYLPASILFTFKIVATMGLLLFAVGFVFALMPDIQNEEVIISRRRR